MPETHPGLCEVSCITVFESISDAPRAKPNTIVMDAPLYGTSDREEDRVGVMRVRYLNREDLNFNDAGTVVKTDLRVSFDLFDGCLLLTHYTMALACLLQRR